MGVIRDRWDALYKRADDLYWRAYIEDRLLTRDEQRAADHAEEAAKRLDVEGERDAELRAAIPQRKGMTDG